VFPDQTHAHLAHKYAMQDPYMCSQFKPMPTWPIPVPYGNHVISSYGITHVGLILQNLHGTCWFHPTKPHAHTVTMELICPPHVIAGWVLCPW